MSKTALEVKRRIVNDLAAHTITSIHSDGLHRHWRCQKPGTINLYFDVVTWPGFMCVTGDMGEWLFRRTDDMVEFMRSSCMSYGYAAEKCVAHRGELTEFCWDDMNEWLSGLEKEATEAGDSDTLDKIEEVRQAYQCYELEHDVYKAIYESGLSDDPPRCQNFTYRFLWILHAIKWFCEKAEQEVPA